jgi:thiamine biosynthesis protein ThiI
MRAPDCILVRFGEISLKSKQVQRVWMDKFLSNVRKGLDEEKIKYSIKVNPSRLFIYTKQMEKTSDVLKRIFGITSFSYTWTCRSDMKDMGKTATELAVDILKLNKKKSFAIRARRSGNHTFTSQDIGREVGSDVNDRTGAKVNLTDPDHEIFVECRQSDAYAFTGRTEGPGGMPLATAGRILAVIDGEESVAAAWLLMKRGCTLGVVAKKKDKKFIKIIERWHVGRSIMQYTDADALDTIKSEGYTAVVVSENSDKKLLEKLYEQHLLVFRPLVGLTTAGIREIWGRVNPKKPVK